MDADEDLILGFAHLLKPAKKHKIDPEYFPSKIGGLPTYLIPEQFPSLSCSQCNNPLKFLLQIYAPLDSDSSYHRTLYLFFCPALKCNRKRECLKVFRAQIPQKNVYYNNSDNLPTEKYKDLLKNCNNKEDYLYFQKEYLIKTEIIDKSEVQEQIFLSEERIKELLHQPTNLNYDEFQDNQLKKNDFKHETTLLEQFKEKQSKAEEKYEDIEEIVDMNEKIDKNYEKYKFLLEINNNQEILRYMRGKNTNPLWISENDQWQKQEIRKCSYCGGRMIFEFQINSTFLNLYKELIDFDWGIIAVYTCEKSCESKENYVEELAFVQFSKDELKIEELKFGKMEEIPEEIEKKMLENKEKKKKNKKKKKTKEETNDNKSMPNEEEKNVEIGSDDDWV